MGKKKSEDATSKVLDESVDCGDEKNNWEDKIRFLNPISSPLASKKLTKKIHKTVKKASSLKSLGKGIKDVKKRLVKGEKGIVIIAGDVSPIDIVSHIPVLCEDSGVQYCYVPSKKDLGECLGSKRQACIVMIKEHKDIKDEFNECNAKIKEIPLSY